MPDEKTGRPDEQYVVQMKGITKVYPNGVAANQGGDFFLRKGEIHALMGENGAGKSTLYQILDNLKIVDAPAFTTEELEEIEAVCRA